MIESLEHRGVLIHESTVRGETRAEDVVPAHPNGIQVSRDRWLLVYATRSFRGVDDDLSILYQLRDRSPNGRVIKEGVLGKWVDDWDALGDGKGYVKQHGHPVAFGVPCGALIGGKLAPSANLFVVKWRRCARYVDSQTGLMVHASAHPELRERTQGVEWVQFRLDEAEEDIEIVQPPEALRQKGCEEGETFCSDGSAKAMNQSFTQAVPFNEACTEWADCNHFDGRRIAALKYAYNRERGVYEWVETGPFMDDPERGLSEASLVRAGEGWVIASRTDPSVGGVAWSRVSDPFSEAPSPVTPGDPQSNAPITAYMCPDGVLRLFGGDVAASPYDNGRDPLYCWDVDYDHGFACSNRRWICASCSPTPVGGLRRSPTG